MLDPPSELAFPGSIQRLLDRDPELHREVAADFERLAAAGMAMAWAEERLPRLIEAGSEPAVLDVLVDEAKELTGAPSAWALTWSGDLDHASFRAFAGSGGADVPSPEQISDTVVARAVEDGHPVWSDDATADARFDASESVRAYALRSVGCVPVGNQGVLYLQDPDAPGRFSAEHRVRLTALCRLAGPFLGRRDAKERPRRASARPVVGMVGTSPPMADLYETIRAFAPMPWPALIVGESGVGKELVARALHALSPRADHPFVAVNCGAIPEELAESTLFGHERGAFTGADKLHRGVVERARGGTLFLDEVGELSPRHQVKLLRLIQEGTFERVGGERKLPFRGRVLAATLRDVEDPETRDGFRDDLYYRLAACVLFVPPLRDRREDIPALARHLLGRALADLPDDRQLEIGADALQELCARGWPGNVRELENVIRAAVARALAGEADLIEVEHLRARQGPSSPEVPIDDLKAATEQFQQRMIQAALAATDGNRTEAAKRLGVSRQWLHRLLARSDET